MTTEEAYRILGVEPGTSAGEVQKAYRRLAMDCHPDRARSPEQAVVFTKRFLSVRDAYEFLRAEGFPVQQTEEVLHDIISEMPSVDPISSRFAPKENDPFARVSLAEKLGFGLSVDLEAISLWGVIIPLGGVLGLLFIRWLWGLISS